MKSVILALCLFLSDASLAQKLKSGTAPFDHKEMNMISISFKNDGNSFLQSLRKDFGPGEKYNNDGDGYPGVRWFGIQQPEWNNKKIIVRLYKVPTDNRTIFLINCMDESGEDLLIPETDIESGIKKYFRRKLN